MNHLACRPCSAGGSTRRSRTHRSCTGTMSARAPARPGPRCRTSPTCSGLRDWCSRTAAARTRRSRRSSTTRSRTGADGRGSTTSAAGSATGSPRSCAPPATTIRSRAAPRRTGGRGSARHLEHLARVEGDLAEPLLRVTMADKLSNLRATVRDARSGWAGVLGRLLARSGQPALVLRPHDRHLPGALRRRARCCPSSRICWCSSGDCCPSRSATSPRAIAWSAVRRRRLNVPGRGRDYPPDRGARRARAARNGAHHASTARSGTV